jgi:hypothetical protein
MERVRDIYYKKISMVDEPPIRVGFSVDIIDCVERILEPLVNPYPVALGFVRLVMQSDGFVHLCFLVYVGELVLAQRFSLASLLLLRSAD